MKSEKVLKSIKKKCKKVVHNDEKSCAFDCKMYKHCVEFFHIAPCDWKFK